jgi:hypothetical protein
MTQVHALPSGMLPCWSHRSAGVGCVSAVSLAPNRTVAALAGTAGSATRRTETSSPKAHSR